MPTPPQAPATYRALAGSLALALTTLPTPAHATAPTPPDPLQLATPGEQQVLVQLRFDPPRALRDARLHIVSPRGSSVLAIETPLLTLRLPPGAHELEVTARRHSARISLNVTPGMSPVDVRLHHRRATSNSTEFTRNRGLLQSLVLAGGLHLGVGAAVAVVGGVRKERALRRNEDLLLNGLVDAASAGPAMPTGLGLVEASYLTAEYHHTLGRAMTLELAGTAVLAGGLAALVTAVPVEGRKRRRVAWIGAGLGAAMTAGGAVWLATHLDKREARLAESNPARRVTSSDLRPLGAAQSGAALLTGLGVGLVVYPSLALLSDTVLKARQRRQRASLTPYTAPGQAGLLLHGRF